MGEVSETVGLAASLRRAAGMYEPAFSTRQLVSVLFPSAVIIGHPLPSEIDEAVARTPNGIVIVYRRGMPIGEQRFAVAHALGHLMFDRVCDEPLFRGRGGTPESERRADDFAAELLVPLSHLVPVMPVCVGPNDQGEQGEAYLDCVDLLASSFKVTPALIDQRIRELVSSATSD